jgi:FAD/FMN-containing dehydrogenase
VEWQTIAKEFRQQGLVVIDDPQICQKLSLDYFYFSPILAAQLKDKRADLIVMARNEIEILTIASLCVYFQVPLTIRGAGTGNYGQCIPLEGGVVLDLSQMNRVISLQPGQAVAEPGVRLSALDKQAQDMGWELRMAPSTYQIATLGGFIGGGSVGMGSINHGLLSDRGNLRGARVVTLEDEPQVLSLRGEEARVLLHAYGTNGIISQLDVALAPTAPWAEAIVCFETFRAAAAFAQDLAQTGGIYKKQVAVHAHPIPEYFTALQTWLLPGQSAVFGIISDYDREAFEALVYHHGGQLTDYQRQSTKKGNRLLEFCWNHTTLLARAVDETLTYLQVFYGNLARVEKLHAYFGTEVMIHLEFLRSHGQIVPAGLPLIRYTTEKRLAEIMKIHRDSGADIANPHVYTIEEGGNGQIDPAQLAFKKKVDPYGLLNPGKMKSWLFSSRP